MNLCSNNMHKEEVCYETKNCPACEAYEEGLKIGYDNRFEDGFEDGNKTRYLEGKNDNG